MSFLLHHRVNLIQKPFNHKKETPVSLCAYRGQIFYTVLILLLCLFAILNLFF